MTKKVCISGYYGFDNFGDEIILKTLVENIKSFETETKITVFSSNPAKTSKELGVNSVKSFCPFLVLKNILECDSLISGGGSLLQDVTSKKSLIYYLSILLLARLFNKKTIIFAQGIGPIKNKLLAKLTAFVIRKSSFVTVRDDRSLKQLEDWNITAIKCSDPVWNLTNKAVEKTKKVGIQLRSSSNLNQDFLKELAKTVTAHYSDKEIVLLALQNKLDINVCNNFKDMLKELNPQIDVKTLSNETNEQTLINIAELDELIAMRFHACLIAIKNDVKLLPINYDIKVEEIAKEFDLKTINLEDLDKLDETIEKFSKQEITYDKERIEKHMYNFKALESIL